MSFFDFVGDIAPAVATLGGAYLAYDAAGNAADAQVRASNNSAAVQAEMYNQTREDFGPYRDVGGNALYQLAALGGVEYEGAPGTMEDRYQTALSRFTASPGYQFRLSEGVRARDMSAAAKGRLMSGGYGREMERYAQGVASDEFGTYTNNLRSLAGVGQTATSNTASLGQSNANSQSAIMQQGGAARASGYTGQANAVTGAVNNLLYYYG